MVIPGRARADRFAERPQASLDSGTSSYIDAFRAWLIRQPPATISVLAFKLLLVLLVHMDVIEQRSILLIPTYRGCFKVGLIAIYRLIQDSYFLTL